MLLADAVNHYVDREETMGSAAKTAAMKQGLLHTVCSRRANQCVQAAYDLCSSRYCRVSPAKVEKFLNRSMTSWDGGRPMRLPREDRHAYRHLMARVEEEQLDALFGVEHRSLSRPRLSAMPKSNSTQQGALP